MSSCKSFVESSSMRGKGQMKRKVELIERRPGFVSTCLKVAMLAKLDWVFSCQSEPPEQYLPAIGASAE